MFCKIWYPTTKKDNLQVWYFVLSKLVESGDRIEEAIYVSYWNCPHYTLHWKKNCWAVDLFAVEEVAWGYSSTSVLSCLWKLGFCNKLARSTSKILDHTSMACSFYIWLAQNIRSWEVEHTPLSTKPSSTNEASCQNS